jgi:ABC-type branched-subunit amino acid transport system substrate-binding protein
MASIGKQPAQWNSVPQADHRNHAVQAAHIKPNIRKPPNVMRSTFSKLITTGVLALGLATGLARAADDTVKVGVLHDLSGTMAISETSLRDILLFTFDEINAKGGVMGKKIVPVIEDPGSDWPTFAEKAKVLLEQEKVAVTFGCWTSVSRKSCLPVYEKTTACSSIPCNMRARRRARMCATPRRR